MLQLSRSRLLLAATLISNAIAQSNLPSQITAAAPLATAAATSYPICATNCLAGATGPLPCSETDTRCLCSYQREVRSSVETCLAKSNECSSEDTSEAAGYYETVCQALGLDVNGEPSLAISSGGIATASNVGLIPSSSSSPTRTSVPSPSSSVINSATNQDDTAEDDKSDDGLSVAAVAGIAAGCAFIVVAIITGFIWMYIKRRDGDEEIEREIESQSKKPGFEGGANSFKSVPKSEKETEFAMTSLPPKHSQHLQPPSRRHDSRPTLAERRQKDPRHLARSPSEAMKASTYPFPFGDKRGAEASVTSLALPSSAGKPVSAVIVEKSPTRSLYSDAGSIYSVSSVHSEHVQVANASEVRRSRPTTFYNLYSGNQDGASSVNASVKPATSRWQGSLRKNKFNLQVSTPRLDVPSGQPSPNPFTTPPPTRGQTNPFTTPNTEHRQNPFESVHESLSPVSPISPQERYDPLAQNFSTRRPDIMSGSSFGKFDFEIAQEGKVAGRRSTRSLRDSFLNTLDSSFTGSETRPK